MCDGRDWGMCDGRDWGMCDGRDWGMCDGRDWGMCDGRDWGMCDGRDCDMKYVVGGAMPCDNTDLSPQGRCPWDHRSSEEAWV